MPFQSEKQRRFMWAEHPEIARRWAHEYPESNKNLPQYAQKSHGKNMQQSKSTPEEVKKAHWELLQRVLAPFRKASESVLKEVNVPHSEKPVAAGDEQVTAKRNALSGCDRSHMPDGLENKNKKTPAVLSLFNLQPKKDTAPTPGSTQKIAEILTKYAAVIRLGRQTSQRLQRQYDPRLTNSSIDLQKMQQNSQREAQARLFGATPLPMGMQQQPQPVAAYPGLNSQPQPAQPAQPQPAQPKTAEDKLTGIKPLKPMNAQNAATNPIGIQGGLDSETVTDANGNKRVVPKQQQRMTGNSGFAAPGSVQAIRRA